MPSDGEKDRSIGKDAEIVSGMCVLPNIVAGNNQILAEGLLESRVEFISEAGLKGAGTQGASKAITS